MVFPETGLRQAQQIATRIRELIASDEESPSISVAVGSAAFPEDGETLDKLLSAADRALYDMKRPSASPTSGASKSLSGATAN